MKVLRSVPELAQVPGPVFLAIGVFDGVHLGHRAVIGRSLEDAKAGAGTAVVATFDPHPIRILRPEVAPRLLTAAEHKKQLIEALGVSHLLVIPFTKEFASTPPEEFIRSLADACQPLHEICVGHSWEFGKNRAGNLQLLDRMGKELGFEEIGVPAVKVDGDVVSSTRIRNAVRCGDLDRAARFLGREYSILGTVERGQGLGRKLGFATANLSAHSEQFPPDGVYAVDAMVRGERKHGVVNLGVRPTVSTGKESRILEVHVFDMDIDCYGEEVEVFFRAYIRPEKKFENIEALRAQIARDIATANRL